MRASISFDASGYATLTRTTRLLASGRVCITASSAARFGAAAGARCEANRLPSHCKQVGQRFVHGFRRGKDFVNLWPRHHNIASLGVLAKVLATYSFAELFSFQDRNVVFNLACRYSAHTVSPFLR